MDYVIFFTYSIDNLKNLKSMALVKAKTKDGAIAEFKSKIDKDEYKDFKIWWIDELAEVYSNRNVIIP